VGIKYLAEKSAWASEQPQAIGRSKADPSSRMSAGARLTVTLYPEGKSKPQFFTADRTRSRISFTALSGRPTTLKNPLEPGVTSTSTSTRKASMP
jgi:hypothetical protein